MSSTVDFLTPGTIGTLEVKNRVLMAPLTRARAELDGTPGALAKIYYKQRAGAGLIISEATPITHGATGYICTPGIYNDKHVAGWKEIVDAVHSADGKIYLQLWHVGRVSHTSVLPEGEVPVAPSAIAAKTQVFTAEGPTDASTPRALELEELAGIVADYKAAAERAKKAGFDGVEIHGANGYLLDQFLRDSTNKRTDAYGGSAENRTRLLLEVVDAVTEVYEPGRVGVRLSPTGTFNDIVDSDPEATFGVAIDALNTRGLGYLHMVENFGAPQTPEQKAILSALRKRWKGDYIANGGYDDPAVGREALRSGYADAVAYGRLFISNPDLPTRLEAGAELTTPREEFFYAGGAEGYTDYPALESAA